MRTQESSISNLKSARQAIEAELEHAREGVAYYQSRVEALEEALEKIDSVNDVPGRAAKAGKTAKSKKSSERAKPGRRAHAASEGSDEKLPPTGKDFWPTLITDEPKSAPEILDAAVKALGISPSRDQLKKLSQRQTNALNAMVKAGAIADSGSGRARRFYRHA